MHMKNLLLASALVLAPSVAFSEEAKKPAIATPNSVNPSAPVKGKNSFTEAQARDRIEKAGFRNVTDLMLTNDGLWQASAMSGGGAVTVQLDYQGNVTAKPK